MFEPPRIPIFSAQRAEFVPAMDADFLWEVTRRPVAFRTSVERLEQSGPHLYVDLGPSGTLAGFVKQNLSPSSRSEALPLVTPFGRDLRNLALLEERLRPAKLRP